MPRSLLGLAVPVCSKPLARREDGRKLLDVLTELDCTDRDGKVVALGLSSFAPRSSLDILRCGNDPGILPGGEAMTETGEVAVVALSIALSYLATVKASMS